MTSLAMSKSEQAEADTGTARGKATSTAIRRFPKVVPGRAKPARSSWTSAGARGRP